MNAHMKQAESDFTASGDTPCSSVLPVPSVSSTWVWRNGGVAFGEAHRLGEGREWLWRHPVHGRMHVRVKPGGSGAGCSTRLVGRPDLHRGLSPVRTRSTVDADYRTSNRREPDHAPAAPEASLAWTRNHMRAVGRVLVEYVEVVTVDSTVGEEKSLWSSIAMV
jgi:hypothetical protein